MYQIWVSYCILGICVNREYMKSSCPQQALLSYLTVTLNLLVPFWNFTCQHYGLVVILPCSISLPITQVRGAKPKKSHHESEGLWSTWAISKHFYKRKGFLLNSENPKIILHIVKIQPRDTGIPGLTLSSIHFYSYFTTPKSQQKGNILT